MSGRTLPTPSGDPCRAMEHAVHVLIYVKTHLPTVEQRLLPRRSSRNIRFAPSFRPSFVVFVDRADPR